MTEKKLIIWKIHEIEDAKRIQTVMFNLGYDASLKDADYFWSCYCESQDATLSVPTNDKLATLIKELIEEKWFDDEFEFKEY